ncbi:1-phosphatidylinositol phosphodiesterase-like [Osmerus eperlanus]|uniref:1-phosphatidylinositol phosphodiesterase-like n=1 Tax=Osmerus eperlanus TaxID=29151 RepID=UPI002E135128
MKTTAKSVLYHFYALLLFMAFSHGKDLFNDNGNLQLPDSYNIGWMGAIEDDTFVSNITIPGTHDTMALYGGPLAECQAWNLNDQLRAGIRYLDLRIFALENKLYVMHGVVYQHTSFIDVFDTIRAFLSEFPSEMVLVRVKPDLFDKDNVEKMVEKMVSNDKDVWVRSVMPTMGMARGKIVFVQKSSFKLGVPLLETDTKGDYEVTHIADKENTIDKCLTQAAEDTGRDKIVLSYSSGTGVGTFWGMFLTPKKVSEKIDPWLDQYLRRFFNDHPGSCLGVIAMDFPGIDLIQEVIKFNK